jgi:hypothetical protein
MVSTAASLLGIGMFARAGIAAALSLLGLTAWLEWSKAQSDRNMSAWSYVVKIGNA